MRKVFYCWQSNLPYELNNTFIEDCIKEAIELVNNSIPSTNSRFILDKDTSGVSGSPPVTEIILNKINECSVFIADISNVGKINTNPKKFVPNPNVLIEYGYALKSVSNDKIVAIINEAYGSPDQLRLPFDIDYLRWPISYNLSDQSTSTEIDEQKDNLKSSIFEQLKIISKTKEDNKELEVEIFEDVSKLYNGFNGKIIIVLRIKIINKGINSTSVKLDKISWDHNGNTYVAIRTTLGPRIQTTTATVGLNHDDLIPREEDVRVDDLGFSVKRIAFEMDKINEITFNRGDKIKVNGIVESYDGLKAEFYGEINVYH